MEQVSNQNFASGSMRAVQTGGNRTNSAHRHHQSTGGHVKNQHSYTSQNQQLSAHSNGSRVRGAPNSNLNDNQHVARTSAEKRRPLQQNGNYQQQQQQYTSVQVGGGTSAAPSAQAKTQNNSSSKKQNRRSRVNSMSKDYAASNAGHSSLVPVSLENSFKGNKNGGIMMGESQTAQQSLQSLSNQQSVNQIIVTEGGLMNDYNASTSLHQQRLLISDAVGGAGLSPITGTPAAATNNTNTGYAAAHQQVAVKQANNETANMANKRESGSVDEVKRQQMRQIKNLQKLQKSGQSRKKSTQFGKSNKILLMSGTKSKMMEMSAAAGDKSMTKGSGAFSKGTATLIELRQVASVTPDLTNEGPQGASQTYNNASRLLASANEIDLNVSDYGGFKQNKQATNNQNQSNANIAPLMLTLSEDNDLQPPDGVPMTSIFDQLEEMQFMSYELGTKLRGLVETICQHSESNEQYMIQGSSQGFMVQADTWESIQFVAKEATSDFEIIQESLRQFFDRMQEEVSKWKRRCGKLQTKLHSVQNMPPKPIMGVSRSQGKHAKNGQEEVGRITISGNGGRKGQYKQSNSLNHSGMQDKKERLMLQKSLIEIVNVYDKNRTQIYSNLEEMESRVNEFKNTREKLSVQHLGTMTTVEQEMEQLCLRSARSKNSQGQPLKSHRSQPSASKRPMTSLEASRRSSRADLPSDQQTTHHNHKPSIDRRDAILNTPKIMSSGQKQKPKAQSSGIRSPSNAGRAQSLVPPLPIHMISNLNKDPNVKSNSKKPQLLQYQSQQQNSARSTHSRPPPPESYRSHRSRQQAHQQHSARQDSPGGANSRRSAHNSGRSNGNSSQQNITGAIVNGALVNAVMLQANTKIATSKFDKGLEADFEGDDATLLFDTERLKQFPDDYAYLEALESTDQKILVKQCLFMKYERALKVQAKEEKVVKEQRKKERQAQEQVKNVNNGNKRRQNSQGTASGFNVSNRSFRSGANNGANGNKNGNDVGINQILDISAIQLESSLSEIGTIEGLKARAGEKFLEAQLSEMLAVSQNNISGLKTVTQKDLVFLAEQHWQQKEQLKRENRKVLEWSGEADENDNLLLNNNRKENQSEDANKNILAGLSVDEPSSWKLPHLRQENSVPISPSHIKMQGPTNQQLLSVQNSKNSVNSGIHVTSLDTQNNVLQNNMLLQQIDGPSPIRPNPDASQPPGDSFYNDSSGIAYLESDLEQLTPQQVRANPATGAYPANQVSSMMVKAAGGVALPVSSSAPPKQQYNNRHQDMAEEQNLHQFVNYAEEQHPAVRCKVSDVINDIGIPYEPVVGAINAVANATSNSEQSSLYIHDQKKSLEVITERQSEFSNTMGTFARPSQRSKNSKGHNNSSSNTKGNGGTRGGQSSVIIGNASQASLNNSSSAHINSSRHKNGNIIATSSGVKQNQQQMVVQSFVDITDQEILMNSNPEERKQAKHHHDRGIAYINDNSKQNVGYYQVDDSATMEPQNNRKQRIIENSVQYSDMAAHTPLRVNHGAGVGSSGDGSRKQQEPVVRNESTNQQNVTRQQVAYKHLMYELKGQKKAPVEPSIKQHQPQLRQRQQQITAELQGYAGEDSVHSSYVDNSCYVDESNPNSSSVDQQMSSVKKQRKQKNLPGHKDQQNRRSTHSVNRMIINTSNGAPQSQTPQLKRSNSEVYLKNTAMQNEEDALFVPIPIMYAAMEGSSLQQSLLQQSGTTGEAAKIKIDQSQLNNLTRYLEANKSAKQFGNGPDSNGTFQINNTLYNQLQKIFMQHQTQQSALQDMTGVKFSQSVDKVAGYHNVMAVEQPSILNNKPTAGFSITSLLNESLQQPHLQKRTLQMLQHLQGYQNHNFNSAVGMIFSNSGQYMGCKSAQRKTMLMGSIDNTRGLSPKTDHKLLGQSLLQKLNSPIVDHFGNHLQLDKTELRRSLLEGYPQILKNLLQADQVNNQTYNASIDGINHTFQDDHHNSKFRSEVVSKGQVQNKMLSQQPMSQANHGRGLSKEAVSSYVNQVKRPSTNIGIHQIKNINNSVGSKKSHAVQSTSVSSANIKMSAGSKQQLNSQQMQKSLLAYQSIDVQSKDNKRSDYVDQSVVSHSHLGMPSSSLSIISRSVERQSANVNDSNQSVNNISAQSNLQRKLRLKTNKQFKFTTERGAGHQGLKPRPASSMLTNSRQASESEGRSGMVNVSTVSAKPTASQFKILSFNSGSKVSSSSATRDKSNTSSTNNNNNRIQLQSQPQLTKQQQLQLQLQQSNLAQQVGNYGGHHTNSSGSGQNKQLVETNQKGPVLKRINIKKIPSVKRVNEGGKPISQQQHHQQQQMVHGTKSTQSGIHVRNLRNQEIKQHGAAVL